MNQKIKLNRYLKFSFSFLIFLFITSFSLSNSSVVHANSCSQYGVGFVGMAGPFTHGVWEYGWQDIRITGLARESEYKITCDGPSGTSDLTAKSDKDGVIERSKEQSFGHRCWDEPGIHRMYLRDPDGSICELGTYEVVDYRKTIECSSSSLTITKSNGQPRQNSACFEADDTITLKANPISSANNLPVRAGTEFFLSIEIHNDGKRVDDILYNSIYPNQNGEIIIDLRKLINPTQSILNFNFAIGQFFVDDFKFQPVPFCTIEAFMAPAGECDKEHIRVTGDDPYAICNQVDAESKTVCNNCLNGTTLGGESGIWTSLGCIPSEGKGMIRRFIVLGLSLAGGIGLLMIIAAGAMFTMSQNDPKKVGDAKELLTSVVIGLLFIAFSVTILQFIGVTVFRIPGFGG